MLNKPTVITPEQIKSAALDILSLSREKQALVYGFMQGVLAAKAPAPTTPAKRYRRPRTST